MQFARGFNVADKATPATEGLFLSRRGDGQQTNVIIAEYRVAMGDIPRGRSTNPPSCNSNESSPHRKLIFP